MKVKCLFSILAIILLLSTLLAIGNASAADVLKIDEHRSYVTNLATGAERKTYA